MIIMATSGTNRNGKVLLLFMVFFLSGKKMLGSLQISVEFTRLNHHEILGFSKFMELNSHKKSIFSLVFNFNRFY